MIRGRIRIDFLGAVKMQVSDDCTRVKSDQRINANDNGIAQFAQAA